MQPLSHLAQRVILAASLAILTPAASNAATVKIATFNIQILGTTKINKPSIRKYLATVIRKFDIVAVQEIKDSSQTVPDILLEEINKTGRNYRFVISERTGKQPNDQSGQEQYAYYYNADRIEVTDEGGLFDDTADDLFQREPFTAGFGVKGTSFTVTITSIHTRPESAVEEIEALHDVYLDVQERYPDYTHHLILGDFNASCSYATPAQLNEMEIRGADFHWIVPDTADTNVNPDTECAYDRLVANEGLSGHFKRWGIADWFTDKRISDHWPVWVTFGTASP
jgi:endonuclease/exonuclease/phosphatase family metal-dependent hydrolase